MPTDERFDVPLYSVTEAARHLDVPVSTFRTWVHGYVRLPEGKRPVTGKPIVTTLPRDAGVSVPFVGLAEAHALAAVRGAGSLCSTSDRRWICCSRSWVSSMYSRRGRSTQMALSTALIEAAQRLMALLDPENRLQVTLQFFGLALMFFEHQLAGRPARHPPSCQST
ncbi:MAG: hypothetical protein ACRDRK_27280 [Pseudonocardia sp.]